MLMRAGVGEGRTEGRRVGGVSQGSEGIQQVVLFIREEQEEDEP